MIKAAFCSPKKLPDNNVWVLEVLSASSFNIEQSMLKLAVKSNACAAMAKLIDVNPLMHFWRILSTSRLLVCSFLEYFKLVETSMVQFIGSMEDEPCFNSLAFCKSKLHN